MNERNKRVLFKIGLTYLILLTLLLLTMCSCVIKTEFYYKGNPCYTRQRCVSRNTVHKCDFHYGMNPLTGKEEYFYGDYTEEECVEYKIDTLIIKPRK
jgi:hypothetical protein